MPMPLTEAAARARFNFVWATKTRQHGLDRTAVARLYVHRVFIEEYPLVRQLPLEDALEHVCRIAVRELADLSAAGKLPR